MAEKRSREELSVKEFGDHLESRVKRLWRDLDVNITSIRLSYDGYKWLAVVAAKVGEAPMVHFHSHPSLGKLLLELEDIMWHNKFQWRKDKFRQP